MARRGRRIRKNQPVIVHLLARRLREERVKRGISQMKLAAKSGVDLSYLGRIERSEVEAGVEMVSRLAEALGVSNTDLLSDGTTREPLAVLRKEVQEGFAAVLQRADRPTLQTMMHLHSALQALLGHQR